MKTQNNLLLLASFIMLAFFLTSCGEDAFVEQDALTPQVDRSEVPVKLQERGDKSISADDGHQVTRSGKKHDFAVYSILEVRKQVLLNNADEQKGLPGTGGLSETAQDKVELSKVMISGEGDSWSQEFGRMRTKVEISYDPFSKSSNGVVNYILEDGTRLSVNLFGDQPITQIPLFDGPHMALILTPDFGGSAPENVDPSSIDALAYLLDAEMLEDPDVTSYQTKLIIKGTFMNTP